jgi:hypothetical protein
LARSLARALYGPSSFRRAYGHDEPRLLAALTGLTPRERVAFAIACALRLRPYFGYPDNPSIPSELDAAFAALIGYVDGSVSHDAVLAATGACENTLKIDDDLVAAVIYASRVPQPDEAQAAVWVARRAYEARDRHVADALAIDFNRAGAEQTVLRHPVVQSELGRQIVDLASLAAETTRALQLLARARAEPTTRPVVRAPTV